VGDRSGTPRTAERINVTVGRGCRTGTRSTGTPSMCAGATPSPPAARSWPSTVASRARPPDRLAVRAT